jgi:hypothetical protein
MGSHCIDAASCAWAIDLEAIHLMSLDFQSKGGTLLFWLHSRS